MSIYLSLLAGSSILAAPLNKGSRDFFRIRNLTRLAAASSAYLTVAADSEPQLPQLARRWRDYNLTECAPADGWRDYQIPMPASSYPAAVSARPIYNLQMRSSSVHQQLDHQLRLTAAASHDDDTSASLSATPLSGLRFHDMFEQRMALDAFIEGRQSKGYDVKEVDEDRFLVTASSYSPRRVEEAVRESWKKSGLRISPFRLQGLGRL